MKTIGFIGLGLIGGSIARTIRKFHPDYRLLAFDKDRSALAEAVSLNVINGICDIDDEQLYNCSSSISQIPLITFKLTASARALLSLSKASRR